MLLEAVNEIEPVLKAAGYAIALNKIEIKNEQQAAQHKFLSSPTIRVNGRDICLEVRENNCGCCSDISGDTTDCRVFVYDGIEYEVPPKAMLINAILKAVYAQSPDLAITEPYSLPKNLKRFFAGKNTKSTNCCGGGDCCT